MASLMGCLHDPANVQQTSSKCIQNTRANAGRLLEVCWTFAAICYNGAGRLLDRVNALLMLMIIDVNTIIAIIVCMESSYNCVLCDFQLVTCSHSFPY